MSIKIMLPKREDIVWVFLLSFIVLLPNIYLVFSGSDFNRAPFAKMTSYLCFSGLLFLLPSLFLKAKYFFIFHGIFVVLAPIEIAHIYLNRMTVTVAFLSAILKTDWHEAIELLSSLYIPIILFLVIWTFYFYATFKKIKNTWFIPSKKIKLMVLGIFLLSLIAGYSFYWIREYRIAKDKDLIFKNTTEVFLLKFYKIYPCDLILKSKQVYLMEKNIRANNKRLQGVRFDACQETASEDREIYVFVIGETGRYSSYSINGYERETSPLLKQMDNLVSYSDFYSEANVTNSSLPFILTPMEAKNYNPSVLEKSFVDAFKEAGFKTYWIANQSAGDSFIRRISRDTDKEYFSTTDFDAADNYDENLWIYLDNVLANNDKKALIVLHTLGSHFRYNFRYPAQFDVFKPSFQGAFDYALISPKNKYQFINTYDNSILYADYFLAHTIRKIDSLNVVGSLIYVADHGENLFDTEENIVLHAGVNYTEYDFHVPFFVWTSNKYNLQYPSKAANIRLNKDKKLNTSRIFHSITDIAGITFPRQIREKSIASELLQEDSIRHIIDIDMNIKELR